MWWHRGSEHSVSTDQNEPLKSAHQQLWNDHVISFKPQRHGWIQGEATVKQLVLVSLVLLADFMEENTVY